MKELISTLEKIYKRTKEEAKLVHFITGPIVMNQIANLILSTGSRPIMAENEDEVASITNKSDSLGINISTITSCRERAIYISAKEAFENNIPTMIDGVGIGCSIKRQDIVKKLITLHKDSFLVIKGNASEIFTLLSIYNNETIYEKSGVDVMEKDKIDDKNIKLILPKLYSLCKLLNISILITGKIDIFVNQSKAFVIKNGNNKMSKITGTGCMLGGIIASYITSEELLAVPLACIMFGIAGENIDFKGIASYQNELLDNFSTLKFEEIVKNMKVDYYEKD